MSCPKIAVCSAMLALVMLFVACGSPPPTDSSQECGETLTGTLEAPEWVRRAAGIDRYRYRARPAEASVEFDLLDADQQKLALMKVHSEPGAEDGDGPSLHARLEGVAGADIEMQVREGVSKAGAYRVIAELERDGQKLGLIADFGEQICMARGAGGELPACVGDLEMSRAGYVLPSCGWSRQRIGMEDASVTSLLYYTPHQMGAPVSSAGGLRGERGDFYATLQVLDRGRMMKHGDVEAWLAERGVDTILGIPAEKLLTFAFLDAPWRGQVQEHANYCKDPDVFPSRSFGLCEASGESDSGDQASPTALLGLPDCLGDLAGPWGDDPDGFDYECEGVGCMGWVWGDPHMRTHDGLGYNFQGAGEFVLAQNLEGDPWVVQARFEPIDAVRDLPACRNVTVTTAVATQLGEHRVAIYTDQTPPLYVDGQPFELGAEELDLPEGARLERDGSSRFLVRWPNGEQLRVGGSTAMRVDFRLPAERAGQIAGLLGYFNGHLDDDFVTRDGQALSAPVGFDELYDVFGAGWRVADDETLFDYFEASGPQDYHIADFPDQDAGIDDLPADELDAARQVCRQQGVRDPYLLEACMLDYICMQSDEVAAQSAAAAEPDGATTDQVMVTGQIRLVESLDAIPDDADQICAAEPVAYLVAEGDAVELNEALELDQPQTTLTPPQTVRSYLLHLDHLPQLTEAIEGRIVFTDQLHGVASSAERLAASASLLAADRQYPFGGTEGLEAGEDRLTLGPDGRSVAVELKSRDGADQIRIVLEEAN